MTRYTKNDFEFGDIIATRSNSILSKGIRWFMKLAYHQDIKHTFSHIAVVINVWGEVWIAEALGWGVRIYPIEQSPYLKKEQMILLLHKSGFNKEQIEKLSAKMISLGGIRYQYENFPQWIIKILFKINLFKKNNEKSIYCSELGAIAINEVYPNTFPIPNMTSPSDHVLNSIYNIIDFNDVLSKK